MSEARAAADDYRWILLVKCINIPVDSAWGLLSPAYNHRVQTRALSPNAIAELQLSPTTGTNLETLYP